MRFLPRWFLTLMLERCYWKVTTMYLKGQIKKDLTEDQIRLADHIADLERALSEIKYKETKK